MTESRGDGGLTIGVIVAVLWGVGVGDVVVILVVNVTECHFVITKNKKNIKKHTHGNTHPDGHHVSNPPCLSCPCPSISICLASALFLSFLGDMMMQLEVIYALAYIAAVA
jgi:hypothetical protein